MMISNPISEQNFDEECVGYCGEQYSMQQLIEFVKEAERGGIITTMTSNHFHRQRPWIR